MEITYRNSNFFLTQIVCYIGFLFIDSKDKQQPPRMVFDMINAYHPNTIMACMSYAMTCTALKVTHFPGTTASDSLHTARLSK